MQHHQGGLSQHDSYRRLDLIPFRGKREALFNFFVFEYPSSNAKVWKPQDDGAIAGIQHTDDLIKR